MGEAARLGSHKLHHIGFYRRETATPSGRLAITWGPSALLNLPVLGSAS